MINIKTVNKNEEPLDIQHVNIKEAVFFTYEAVSSTSFLDLNGTEKWIWNFDADAGGTSGIVTDQVIQEFIGFDSNISVVFYRSGDRRVQLDVYSPSGTNWTLKYNTNVSFYVYDFPKDIIGPDFAVFGSSVSFSIKSDVLAETYKWYVNGDLQGSSTNSLTINPFNVRSVISCDVINGVGKVTLKKTCTVSIGNSVMGKKYESDVTPELMFFNKEGDNLNFEYLETDTGVKRWEGDLIFHQNSSDTFKTIGLYILEKVNPIKFEESSSDMFLRKLQVFNENGIDFETKHSDDILIEDIQVVNNESTFYTKWIIANNIQNKIPIGSEVYFEDVYSIDLNEVNNDIIDSYTLIPEFDSYSSTAGFTTFTVIGNRKDAIMILTETANNVYTSSYGTSFTALKYGFGDYRLSNNAIQKIPQGKLKCLNFIKIFNSKDFDNEWNDQNYKQLLDDNKKITIVNSQKNDGVYTVSYIQDDFNQKLIKINKINSNVLIPDTNYGFKLELNFKTNKIFLSSVPVDFLPRSNNGFLNDKNILVWEKLSNKDYTPALLKSGLGLYFVQTDPAISNFDFIYEVFKIGLAKEILTPQSDDEKGFKLKLVNYDLLKNYSFKILVNGKSKYQLKEGVHWHRGATLTEAAFNLGQTLTNAIQGISVIVQDSEIWIWEKTGYTFSMVSVNTHIFTFQKGVLLDNRPKYGIVGDEWVLLDNSDYNGYIHYKKSQGNYNIVYFKGTYPNEVASWYTLPDDKKIVWVDSDDFTFAENLISDCYLTQTALSFTQSPENSTSGADIISRFVSTYQSSLNLYGIDLFLDGPNLCLARNNSVVSLDSKHDYVDVNFYIDNTKAVNNFTANTSGTAGTNVPDSYVSVASELDYKVLDLINIEESLITEYNHTYGKFQKDNSISKNFNRKIIVKDIDQKFGFVLTINGIDYQIAFDNVSSSEAPVQDSILDIEETLMDWGNKRFALSQEHTPLDNVEVGRRYFQVLEGLGVLVWLEKSEESYVEGVQHYDTIVIESKYPNVFIDYSVNGTLDTHKILHSDVQFNDIGNLLTITINRVPYSIANQGSVTETLVAWKDEYEVTLLEQEIIVDHFSADGGTSGSNFVHLNENTLRFSTLREKTNLKYQIWVGKNPTLNNNLYTITDYRPGKAGIILAGNQINLTSGADFQDAGFATGMIVSVTGSQYPLNNQEYNIIFVDPTILELSYQGPFWDSTDEGSDIEYRSGYNWYLHDDVDPLVGVNLVEDPGFDNVSSTSGWWNVSSTAYGINNRGRIEFEESIGIKSPSIEIVEGNYRISYTTYNEGTSGFYSSAGFYNYAQLRIFKIITPTILTKVYENYPLDYGTIDEVVYLPTGNIQISIYNDDSSNNFISVDNIILERLPDAASSGTLALNTREFLRYPRERYDGEDLVEFRFSWIEEEETSMFFYDFTGEQLKNRNDGIYQYTGTYPLVNEDDDVFLNDSANKDLAKVSDMKYQQTIFDELTFKLKLIDSEDDLNPLPVPMQVFIGYKSLDEGVNKRTLSIHRLENVSVVITTMLKNNSLSTTNDWINIVNFDEDKQEMWVDKSDINFIDLGFKIGQRVVIKGKDITSKENQAVFKNSGFEGEILLVNVNRIKFNPLNKDLKSESSLTTTRNLLPPFRQRDAAMEISIEVAPQEIALINIKGQTEIEDERFKVMLDNFGYNINHRDIFIFKEYDIKENGIDWAFLNKKRKEMLLNYPEIYNYLGSYKALVNAINYFGYNDLELYEYYLNIDKTNKDFNKLHKIEIPDIFDNTVKGWTPKDYIIKSLPDNRYQKTKLFNLTYRITDFDGNIILGYSLDEVITKLLGLKKWLREHIMPIGTRIKDITGRADTVQTTALWHDVKTSTKFRCNETLTPIDFNIEGYLQPVENNSRTYNMHMEFFANTTDFNPDYYHVKITTFAAKPDYTDPNFKLRSVQLINEYKTDFTSYNFAADKIMDPFILIEITCDNGYGATYKLTRTYSLDSLAFI